MDEIAYLEAIAVTSFDEISVFTIWNISNKSIPIVYLLSGESVASGKCTLCPQKTVHWNESELNSYYHKIDKQLESSYSNEFYVQNIMSGDKDDGPHPSQRGFEFEINQMKVEWLKTILTTIFLFSNFK